MARGLLVAHQNVPDLRRVHQWVVGRQDCSAGDAENRVDARCLERFDEAFGSGDLVTHRVSLVFGGSGWGGGQVVRVGQRKAPRSARTTRGARKTRRSGAQAYYEGRRAHSATIAQPTGYATAQGVGKTTLPTERTTSRSSGLKGAASRYP